MTDETPQSRIDAKRRVQEYLNDPAIRWAMNEVEKDCIAEFESAKSAPELYNAQSYLRAIRGLAKKLLVVVDRGEVEEVLQERETQKNILMKRTSSLL